MVRCPARFEARMVLEETLGAIRMVDRPTRAKAEAAGGGVELRGREGLEFLVHNDL